MTFAFRNTGTAFRYLQLEGCQRIVNMCMHVCPLTALSQTTSKYAQLMNSDPKDSKLLLVLQRLIIYFIVLGMKMVVLQQQWDCIFRHSLC